MLLPKRIIGLIGGSHVTIVASWANESLACAGGQWAQAGATGGRGLADQMADSRGSDQRAPWFGPN
jgi:hypothetical protein